MSVRGVGGVICVSIHAIFAVHVGTSAQIKASHRPPLAPILRQLAYIFNAGHCHVDFIAEIGGLDSSMSGLLKDWIICVVFIAARIVP